MRCVIKLGADVNAKNDRGYPMLFYAIIEDNAMELVKLLVEAGADVNAKDDRGHPMLFWAIIEDDNAVELVKLLVEADGADVNAKDDHGNLCSTGRVLKENPVIIQILVDAGAEAR